MHVRIPQPPLKKVRGSLFDEPLSGGGRVVGMGRFFLSEEGEWTEVDWSQMTVSSSLFLQNAGWIARQLGASQIIAPDPDFNGTCCALEDLPQQLPIEPGLSLHFGAPGDCFYPLLSHQVYYARVGGCFVLRIKCVSQKTLRVGVSHVGFKSLFSGVVERLVDTMQLTDAERERCRVSIIAPLHPKSFCHPTDHKTDGERNRALCDSVRKKWSDACVPSFVKDPEKGKEHHPGQIDNEKIAIVECERLGIPRTNIERVAFGIDDGSRHTDGSPKWYTTRNFPEYRDYPGGAQGWRKRRNGIWVTA